MKKKVLSMVALGVGAVALVGGVIAIVKKVKRDRDDFFEDDLFEDVPVDGCHCGCDGECHCKNCNEEKNTTETKIDITEETENEQTAEDIKSEENTEK